MFRKLPKSYSISPKLRLRIALATGFFIRLVRVRRCAARNRFIDKGETKMSTNSLSRRISSLVCGTRESRLRQ